MAVDVLHRSRSVPLVPWSGVVLHPAISSSVIGCTVPCAGTLHQLDPDPLRMVFCINCSYSTVFLGSPGVGAPLSCYKVYEKAALQARHWLNISRECCILSRLQEAR